MKKRILIVATNRDKYDGLSTPTGLWLSEMTHFWDELEPLGFEFDITSPTGGKVPLEPKSLTKVSLDKSTKARLADPDYMSQLETTIAASNVDPSLYDVIYFTGGHGVMFDFPDCEPLQSVTRDIFENEGIVSSVCHGYCGLLNVRLSNGEYLVSGKTMTGFSWREEVLAGVARKVPYNIEKQMIERGANYKKRFIPFMPHVEIDGNLVTGQNPGSARKTAKAVIETLALG